MFVYAGEIRLTAYYIHVHCILLINSGTKWYLTDIISYASLLLVMNK